MTAVAQAPDDYSGSDAANGRDEDLPQQEGTDDAAYRVLIVEDDRSQALFAQSVLQGAGMRTRWVSAAADMMPAVIEFAPDLVLMDLHLPDASGTDLTQAIREDPAHAHMPVVFLTGDPDPETEFRVLDSGADDFLVKPIRPRHLVSAVLSRVKRARAARQQEGQGSERDPRTGLYRRDRLLPLLADAKGALLVEIQGLAALQERYGYAGVEALMRGAGQRLAAIASGPTARLNDNSFLTLVDNGDDSLLETGARQLRDGVGQPLDLGGMPLRLRAAIAWISLATHAVDEPIEALDRTLRRARTEQSGLAGFQRQAQATHREEEAAALQAALRDGGLELAFQPIVAVAGGDEAQFQVLLRMRGEDGQLHSAAELIADAEAAGLLGQVDQWVMAQALALLRPGNGSAGGNKLSRLFVSQSPQAIAADPVGERLRAALDAAEIEPGALVIDLRLDDALVHGLSLAEYCGPLAAHGVCFCLSRYSPGNDASALLRHLPLAFLRLAPRYSHLEARPELRDELRHLIEDAHAAKLRVIGSQVEHPSAAAALWMSGIDYIQGNLIQGAGNHLDFDFHHSVL